MKSLPMTSGFSFDRFKQVTRRLLTKNNKIYGLGIGGTLIGLYAFWLLMMIFDSGIQPREKTVIILSFGTVIYQIGGFILTGSIFGELHKPGTASQFLTLPANTIEKLASGWTVSYVLYTVAVFAGLTLLLLLTDLTGRLFFESGIPSMGELTKIYLNNVVLFYLFFNSVFLLGAVYFRGYNFLKTAFSIVLFFVFVALIMLIVTNVFGPASFSFAFIPQDIITSDSAFLKLLFQLLFALPLTALFLTFSYIRLKNRQVV